MRAAVALGSNLGDRLSNLRVARERTVGGRGVAEPITASSIYETEAVGCEPGAQNFLNAVIEFSHEGSADDLLRALRDIEGALGRPEKHARNESRIIDLDLLYHGEEVIDTPELQLPHPRIAKRRFVLAPLAEIRPDLVLPRRRETVRILLAQLPELPAVVRAQSQW